MQAGNSADRASIAKNVMDVANAPGTKIYPGQLKKGLDLLAKGKKINYEGATGVTFTRCWWSWRFFLRTRNKRRKI